MSLDAMKQALEALELWEENLGNYKNHEWPISIRDGVITITFIPPVRKFGGGRRIELQSAERVELSQKHKFAKESLRAAIKEAEKQEPVAWVGPSWLNPETRTWESESFAPRPIKGWIPLYTAPRQWQGLTDEERIEFRRLGLVGVEIVEAKLKEKNNG